MVVQLFCCEHEEVEVCVSKDEQHFHKYESESECETCKFHVNNYTLNELPLIPLVIYKEISSPEAFFYSLESELVISFRLRGPPNLV